MPCRLLHSPKGCYVFPALEWDASGTEGPRVECKIAGARGYLSRAILKEKLADVQLEIATAFCNSFD